MLFFLPGDLPYAGIKSKSLVSPALVGEFFTTVPSLKVKVKVLDAQSCPTLCDPVDCSPPISSVHGILQALSFVTKNGKLQSKTVQLTGGSMCRRGEWGGAQDVQDSETAQCDPVMEDTPYYIPVNTHRMCTPVCLSTPTECAPQCACQQANVVW